MRTWRGMKHFQFAAKRCAALLVAAQCLASATPPAGAHGDLHERIRALSQQIQTNAGAAGLWLERADLNRQHGDVISARADAVVAARIKPDWPATLLEQARIEFDAAQLSSAADFATGCLELAPAIADALVIRARCGAALGKYAAAVTDYNRVLTLTNGPRPVPDLYLERARAQAALGRLEDAVRGLDEAIARIGATPSLALPALEYERARGDFDAALARAGRARKFFSAEMFHALRADILLQADRRAEAAQEYQAGLTALDNAPPAHRELPQTVELARRLRAGLRQAEQPQTANAN